MPTSAQVVEAAGESGLLLPDLLSAGLAANDRLKYYLTLLQAADAHAREPLAAVADLRGAREASGVSDPSLDDAVARSRSAASGAVSVPGGEAIRRRIVGDLDAMLAPVRATAVQNPEGGARYDGYHRRAEAQVAALGLWAGDEVPAAILATIGNAGDELHDTLHRLIIDLHRELNRLLANVAIESIDGARVSGLSAADRPLVAAFMAGVSRTAGLKFDHPGLGTTASRYGDRLSIQNDLGTTEGHVVILRVTGLAVRIVYSDVHRKRVRFLQQMLEAWPIRWDAVPAAREDDLEIIAGAFDAPDQPALERFLTFVGSRLVFVIDWNRARKALERFVAKADAVAILAWAAQNDVGHRAFLQAGGADLVFAALERVAPGRIRYGARFDALVGEAAAAAYLRSVLRIASTALGAGHSVRLIEDEIEAELMGRLRTPGEQIIALAAEHAMLVSSLAERLAKTLVGSTDGFPSFGRTAALAERWEARADDLVRASTHMLDRVDGGDILRPLLAQADDVADALEEAAFLLTLVPEHPVADAAAAVRPLVDLLYEDSRSYVRCLEYAAAIPHGKPRKDVEAVLVWADRIIELERACDRAERAAKQAIVGASTDGRELYVLFEIVRTLEQAADAFACCARTIRRYALGAYRV